MRNRVKTLAAVAALGMATIGIYSGPGFAETSTQNSVAAIKLTPASTTPMTLQKAQHAHCRALFIQRHRPWFHHHRGPWNLGLHHDKQLSENDARTITKAALLMRGRHNLNVGDVQTKMSKHGHKFYLISIVNTKNNVVSRVVLNSRDGHIHPLHIKHQST